MSGQDASKTERWRAAPLKRKGRQFEDFAVGERFVHHWGRTVSEAEALQFVSLTLAYTPHYFNRDYARALGHKDIVVAPLFVFNLVFGLTVEALSEAGGVFLGVQNLIFHAPVYPGDTLYAESETLSCRASKSRTDSGIVSWRTQGFNQARQLVVVYERSNLVVRRTAVREKTVREKAVRT